jgi:hypothetical protein
VATAPKRRNKRDYFTIIAYDSRLITALASLGEQTVAIDLRSVHPGAFHLPDGEEGSESVAGLAAPAARLVDSTGRPP